MRQRKLTKEEQDEAKKGYEQLFKDRMKTFAGFSFDFSDKATFDDSAAERRKFYEDLWDKGELFRSRLAQPKTECAAARLWEGQWTCVARGGTEWRAMSVERC